VSRTHKDLTRPEEQKACEHYEKDEAARKAGDKEIERYEIARGSDYQGPAKYCFPTQRVSILNGKHACP
jgi:hypothetical protein